MDHESAIKYHYYYYIIREVAYLVSHIPHYHMAICLHGSLDCYELDEDFRYCVKGKQFRVKPVAGYIMILVINNENLLACQIIFQPPLNGVRTPSLLIVSLEHFPLGHLPARKSGLLRVFRIR